jgi:hypothetical protein
LFPPRLCNNIPCLRIKIKTLRHPHVHEHRHKYRHRDRWWERDTYRE